MIDINLGANDTAIDVYLHEMANVLPASVNQTIHDVGPPQDSIALRFSKVKWKYTQQKIGGGAGGNTSGGWDLATNKIA